MLFQSPCIYSIVKYRAFVRIATMQRTYWSYLHLPVLGPFLFSVELVKKWILLLMRKLKCGKITLNLWDFHFWGHQKTHKCLFYCYISKINWIIMYRHIGKWKKRCLLHVWECLIDQESTLIFLSFELVLSEKLDSEDRNLAQNSLHLNGLWIKAIYYFVVLLNYEKGVNSCRKLSQGLITITLCLQIPINSGLSAGFQNEWSTWPLGMVMGSPKCMSGVQVTTSHCRNILLDVHTC